jgi:hypothetical protein
MQLDPRYEYARISEWIFNCAGKHITPRNLARRLSKQLNRSHPVCVKLVYNDLLLDPGDFTIGAEYDSGSDEINKKQFIINLIINHPKHTPWLITDDIANRIAIEIVEVLVHEYQHQHQYRSRGYILNRGYTSKHKDSKIKEDQEYLGQPDEIDAYAANIAARFFILDHTLNTKEINESLDLKLYYLAFGVDHPVIKKLLKKITCNISYLKEHENDKKRRRITRRYR